MSVTADGLGGASAGKKADAGSEAKGFDTAADKAKKTSGSGKPASPYAKDPDYPKPANSNAPGKPAEKKADQPKSDDKKGNGTGGNTPSAYTKDPDYPKGNGKPDADKPADPPKTVVVKPGDTIWGYWKDHGKGTEWQSYKKDFQSRNEAILQNGYLNPGEVAVLPEVKTPETAPATTGAPAPTPALEPLDPVEKGESKDRRDDAQASAPAPEEPVADERVHGPNVGNNPGNPNAPGYQTSSAPQTTTTTNTGNNPGNPNAPGYQAGSSAPTTTVPQTTTGTTVYLPVVTNGSSGGQPPTGTTTTTTTAPPATTSTVYLPVVTNGSTPGQPATGTTTTTTVPGNTTPPGWHAPMAPGVVPQQGNQIFLPYVANGATTNTQPPFSIGPSTGHERLTTEITSWTSAAQQTISENLPSWLPHDVGAMFNSDRGQSAALKVFSPNYDILKGTSLPMPPAGTPIPPRSFYNLPPLPGGQDWKGKLHSWIAVRGEVAVSPSWLSASGTEMRTGTFTLTGSAQVEVVGDLPLPKGDIRSLSTGNLGMTQSFSITTSEARLKDIMTGKVPMPNPYTLENMKPGDTITIFTGPTASAEQEIRLLANKTGRRAGADFKLDKTWAEGSKLTVKMVDNPQNAAEPHVLIMDGNTHGSGIAAGMGGIWNPALSTMNKDGTYNRRLDPYANGAFLRVLGQYKENEAVDNYTFVELNPFDTKTGGQALFNQIMNQGYTMDPNAAPDAPIPGAMAYGTMAVDTKTSAAALQLTGYWEPNHRQGNNNPQFLAQYSMDLVTMIDSSTKQQVAQANPGATVGDTGDLNVSLRYTEGGFTNYFHSYTVNAQKQTSNERYVVTAENAFKDQVIRGLETGMAGTVRLHLQDGTVITGQDAVTWLKDHDQGERSFFGLFDNRDKIGVVMDMGTTAEANAFSQQFIADQKKYHDDQKDSPLEWFAYTYGQAKQTEAAFSTAYFAAPDLMMTPDLAFNLSQHQNAKDANENFRAMAGEGMGNLLSSMGDYYTHNNRTTPYPISVDIYVDFD